MSCPLVYHSRYRDYCFGPEHPFSPLRLDMLHSLLEATGCRPEVVEPPSATREDVLTVHSEAYVDLVAASSKGAPPPGARHHGLGTPDVPVFEGMDEAARHLVGGALHGARMVASGDATRVLHLGGGLHHAQHERAAGFCIYNDLSAAIRHLTAQGLRVAYLDVDVHHGDGVQWLHYDEADVMTVSLHQSGRYFYPGTGFIDELGEAGGRGFKLNVPLEARTTDESYLEAFEQVVPHVLGWFAPDVLVVQCGADAHFSDPLADLLLTTRAFERLFRRIRALADRYADGRALYTLGGGYDFDAAVRVWAILVHVLLDRPLPERLPDDWRRRWERTLGRRLTPTLHDAPPAFALPDGDEIAAANRTTAQRLLDSAAKSWY